MTGAQKKFGSQEPRLKIEPARSRSDGDGAAMLMEAYGVKLDPWQKLIINCWLGRDDSGNYTMTKGGLSVPRQNGKNVCLEAREFFGLAILGEKILHTAHQVKTAKESFKRLVEMFTDENHPEIKDLVVQIRYTNGEEAIELSNGGIIKYSARSRQSNRGLAGLSLLVFDEAQELTDDQLEAIMPTLSASDTGNRQIIYTGTPVYPGCPGTVFRRERQVALENKTEGTAWHEWSVEGDSVDDIETENPELWFETNPALGARLSFEFTKAEQDSMSKDGFARERLGWWAPIIANAQDKAIDAEQWKKCESFLKKPDGKTAFGIKFSADGTEVSLAGAVIPKEGKARISLIDRKSTAHGTRWLAEWLNARYEKASCVVIDGKNGVDLLIDRISPVWRMKGSIIRPTASIMISAASTLIEFINEEKITWYSEQVDLSDSALSSVKRPIAGGWGFGGENSAPIEAASLALWGANTSKRDPTRKMRIG